MVLLPHLLRRALAVRTPLNGFLGFTALISSAALYAEVPFADDVGAIHSFFTIEAEAASNTLSGSGASIARMSFPAQRKASPEQEASGRAYVQLTETGDTLSIPIAEPVNAIVIRHCIPDTIQGGGAEATLTLLVNGQERQKLSLSSRHNWLYGDADHNGQSNNPEDGDAHVFWDEARAWISGAPLQPQDVLQLRKDVDDTAEYYRIDLVDLELAPPALEAPAAGTYVSVLDYGAVSDGVTDATDAIEAAIHTALLEGKSIIWFPPGRYVQTRKLTLSGPLRIQGAGMWHTTILDTVVGTTWSGNVGFNLTGDGPEIADIHFDGIAHTARTTGGKPITGNPTNWTVQRVWITHTNVGLWMSNARDGVVRDSRIRFTYADGINLNRGASNNLVENNHVRGCGDDGIATLSETEHNASASLNNTIRRNTVSCIWWGLNIDLAGGSGHLIEENYLADNSRMGLFGINMTGAYPNHPVSDSTFTRNVLVRGGGDHGGQKRGSVWSFSGDTTITGILLSKNRIIDPMFRAFDLVGGNPQQLNIVDNIIEGPYLNAFHVAKSVSGSALLKSNVINPPVGASYHNPVTNLSPDFTVQQVDNNW